MLPTEPTEMGVIDNADKDELIEDNTETALLNNVGDSMMAEDTHEAPSTPQRELHVSWTDTSPKMGSTPSPARGVARAITMMDNTLSAKLEDLERAEDDHQQQNKKRHDEEADEVKSYTESEHDVLDNGADEARADEAYVGPNQIGPAEQQ
eukprot:12911391-Ditylum_brightwellii.AAC.1